MTEYSNTYDDVTEFDPEADPADKYRRRAVSPFAAEARLQRNLRLGFDGEGTPVAVMPWCGHWSFRGGSICVNCKPERRQWYVETAVNSAMQQWAKDFGT